MIKFKEEKKEKNIVMVGFHIRKNKNKKPTNKQNHYYGVVNVVLVRFFSSSHQS